MSHRNYEATEKLVLALLAVRKPDEETVDIVREYVDVAEYGLALEALVYAMVADQRVPSNEELSLLDACAASMSMDPKTLLSTMRIAAARKQRPVVDT